MNRLEEKQLLRYKYFYRILDEWMALKESGRDIDNILWNANCRRIAIYGMGRMCRHICSVLKDSRVQIIYIIDKKPCDLYGYHIVDMNYDFEIVDLVIYTDVDIEEKIKKQLESKLFCKIINLEDVVFDNIPECFVKEKTW